MTPSAMLETLTEGAECCFIGNISSWLVMFELTAWLKVVCNRIKLHLFKSSFIFFLISTLKMVCFMSVLGKTSILFNDKRGFTPPNQNETKKSP